MFGLFGKDAPPCDWCGAEIAGEPIVDGAMQFCSQDCLAHRNAPPAPQETRARPMTHELACSEVAIADAEAQHYAELADKLGGLEEIESEFLRSQETYLGVWRTLDSVRAYIADRGGEVPHYDRHRQAFAAHPDVYKYRRARGRHGKGKTVGVATYHPANRDLVHAAVAAIRGALDDLGPA